MTKPLDITEELKELKERIKKLEQICGVLEHRTIGLVRIARLRK